MHDDAVIPKIISRSDDDSRGKRNTIRAGGKGGDGDGGERERGY